MATPMTDDISLFLADDFAATVHAEYLQWRRQCATPDEAVEQVMFDNRDMILLVPSQRALFWIALAVTQARTDGVIALVAEVSREVLDDVSWIGMWADDPADEMAKTRQLGAVRAAIQNSRREPIQQTPASRLVSQGIQNQANYDKETAEFTAFYDDRGLDIAKDDPSRVVEFLSGELDLLAPAFETMSEEERKQAVGRISLVWMRQVLRLGTWKLAKVAYDDDREYSALATVDDRAWLPIFFAALDYVKRPYSTVNTLIPLFEAMRSDSVPRATIDGGLYALIRYSWRLENKEWAEQRAQIISDAGTPQSPGDLLANLFGALSAAAANIGDVEEDVDDDEDPDEDDADDDDAEGPERSLHGEDVPGTPPDAQAVARRALAIAAVLSHTTTNVPREILEALSSGWNRKDRDRLRPTAVEQSAREVASLNEDGIWNHLDPVEQETVQTPVTDLETQQLIEQSWRAETLGCLLWALRRVETMPAFDTQMDARVLMNREVFGDGPIDFVNGAKLRDPEELERVRTLAELWNWRSRTRQLHEEGRPFPEMPAIGAFSWNDVARITAEKSVAKGMIDRVVDDDFPALGRGYRELSVEEWQTLRSIAQERHFALNWLRGYAPGNEWQKTPTGT